MSSAGKAIKWDEGEVRGMGRDTMGVRGMNVPPIARVLGMEIAKPRTELFVITEKGFGKRTPVSDYPDHHRGGQGVFTITMTEKKGLLAAMKIVAPDEEIMIMSEEGVVVRTPVSGISELGRSTQGVCVMKVGDGDRVTAVAISSRAKKKRPSGEKPGNEDEATLDLLEEESPRRAASPRTRSTRLKTERLIVRRPAAAPRALAGADPADGPARARRSFLLCGSPFPSLRRLYCRSIPHPLDHPLPPSSESFFHSALSVRPPSNAIQCYRAPTPNSLFRFPMILIRVLLSLMLSSPILCLRRGSSA